MRTVKTSRNLGTCAMTMNDVMARVPARNSSNIRHGHLALGMRDINHIEWEEWEQDTAEWLRKGDDHRLDRANRYYESIERIQSLLGVVRIREKDARL